MNSPAGIREAILDTMTRRLRFEDQAIEQLRINGRLDEITAMDSILVIELVLVLEERFKIRFDPKHIDVELICDLNRLSTFISQARSDS
jgi:acyl carrier protein